MKKVDSNNGVWVNDDPATLTNGTPIDADFMNNIQDEIANVITDNGNTLDGSNHSQLSQTLDKTFAKLNSPTLTGIPLTSNPDGTINNQIATVDYVNQKALQATVGFTPTQQGGGTDQGANKIYIGGDSTDATQARVQVDQTDLGKIAFQAEDNDTYGISKIGFSNPSQCLAFYDTGNKAWHYSYTTDYIDGKAYISSLPTGDNVKVTDIIWNTSSNLPAYYYGADNQVSYSATTDWVNGNFATQTSLSNEINTRSSEITNLQNSKQNNLGFTPVQQGGGAYQASNKVYLGWDGSGLRCQVDSSDLGQLALVSQLPTFPVTQGVYPDGTIWRKIGNYLEMWFSLTLTTTQYSPVYTYPVAFSDTPTAIITAQDGKAHSGHVAFCGPAGGYPTSTQIQGSGLGGGSGQGVVGCVPGTVMNFYIKGAV